MPDQLGNVNPTPAFKGKATAFADFTHPNEILFAVDGLIQKGLTVKPGIGLILAGTLMGRITATKTWCPYSAGASDGSQVARGFLRDDLDTGTAAAPIASLGNIVLAGSLRNSKLSGVDAGALTVLNARQDTVIDLFQF